MNTQRSSFEFLIVAAAAIAVIMVYTTALPGPFVFDDESNITENRHVRIRSLSWDELSSAAFKSPIPNRPVANLSLALNYYFNGYNVVGYRFANILIHIVNGFLLYGLARVTFRTPAMAGQVVSPEMAAAFAALVWLVHPLHKPWHQWLATPAGRAFVGGFIKLRFCSWSSRFGFLGFHPASRNSV